MAMYRTVSCTYTDEHLSMVIMSIIAIGVYPIGFMVLITYCSFMYKGVILQPARIEWLKQYAFLLNASLRLAIITDVTIPSGICFSHGCQRYCRMHLIRR